MRACACQIGSQYSQFYKKSQQVLRRGGALSPYLFVIFIDDLAKLFSAAVKGCSFGFTCLSIILYVEARQTPIVQRLTLPVLDMS